MPNRLFLLLQISVCLSTATTISLKIDRSAIHIAISRMTITMGERLKRDLSA